MSRVSVFGSGGGWRLEVGGCGGCGGWRLPAGRLAIRAIVAAALPRCTVTFAAPRAFEVPSAGRASFSSLVGCMPRLSLSCCPTLLPCRGTRKRAPEASTAQRANLDARPRVSARASPRLASSRYTSPRLATLCLACSRPRRASVSYIALAFVLIISNGAAARERNTSIADARRTSS